MKILKTLLLGGIVSCMTILGFTNAGSITLTSDGSSYSPSSISGLPAMSPFGQYVSVDFNGNSNCVVHFESEYFGCYEIAGSNEGNCNYQDFEGGTITIYDGGGGYCSSITLTSPYFGGSDGGDNSGIGDLTSQLTPVITGLTNSINEFIPYMVYISLGVLGVVIGFFAIKRLMRYVKGSTLSVFNSRRKRK